MKIFSIVLVLLLSIFILQDSGETEFYKKNFPKAGLSLILERAEIVDHTLDDRGDDANLYGVYYKYNNSDEHFNKYFAFSIYEPVEWYESIDEWINKLCQRPIKPGFILDSYQDPDEEFTAFRVEQYCTPLKQYLILHDGKIYKFEATDDTYDHDGLWEVIKTAKFDEP